MHLASRFIGVNAIHPTNVNTHLMHHDAMYGVVRPDLEHPTREDAELGFTHFQAMPIPYIEPVDVANLAVFLASDEARYITGQQIRIDAGALIKFPNGPTSLGARDGHRVQLHRNQLRPLQFAIDSDRRPCDQLSRCRPPVLPAATSTRC